MLRKDFSGLIVVSDVYFLSNMVKKYTKEEVDGFLANGADLSKTHDKSIIGVCLKDRETNEWILVAIVKGGKLPSDCSRIFYGFSSVKEIEFADIDASEVTTANLMFNGCVSVEKMVLPEFPKTIIIKHVIFGCFRLNELTLGGKPVDLYSL